MFLTVFLKPIQHRSQYMPSLQSPSLKVLFGIFRWTVCMPGIVLDSTAVTIVSSESSTPSLDNVLSALVISLLWDFNLDWKLKG